MTASLGRIILFVYDVRLLTEFYHDHFGLPIVETTAGEWSVLQAGSCQLALHDVGEAYRRAGPTPPRSGEHSNAKIVFTVPDLRELRERLIESGVPMREVVSYPGTGPLCDGTDPEGNLFQLSQA